MSWSIDDIPDQSGRVAVVTGANGGLGLETAEALAGKGAHVVMAVRNQEKAAAAEDRIRSTHPDASVELTPLDLGSQDSIKRAAETIRRAHPRIDLLVNNAGVMAMPERHTDDGYEMQFGVNHLGHWTLTAKLLPCLLRSDAEGRKPRVVTVTSVARFTGTSVDPKNPHLRGKYNAWGAYGQAKLSNYDFGLGLQRAFERAGVGVASVVAHPGLSNTDLQSHTNAEGGGGIIGAISEPMARYAGMDAAGGARMQLRAATDPTASGGELYAPLFASNGPAVRRPILRRFRMNRNIATLWQVSERETGVTLDVDAARAALAP
ncbi:MAG: oxidoreductase [Acidimicrobiales bacterium]|nr:oxidoreductase [Acidimicrobiales bacterium]